MCDDRLEDMDYTYRIRIVEIEVRQQVTGRIPLTLTILPTWLDSPDFEAHVNITDGLADHYYKAMVRRCRHTPIGREADRMRWFPKCSEE